MRFCMFILHVRSILSFIAVVVSVNVRQRPSTSINVRQRSSFIRHSSSVILAVICLQYILYFYYLRNKEWRIYVKFLIIRIERRFIFSIIIFENFEYTFFPKATKNLKTPPLYPSSSSSLITINLYTQIKFHDHVYYHWFDQFLLVL